jgi:hypothetical protein
MSILIMDKAADYSENYIDIIPEIAIPKGLGFDPETLFIPRINEQLSIMNYTGKPVGKTDLRDYDSIDKYGIHYDGDHPNFDTGVSASGDEWTCIVAITLSKQAIESNNVDDILCYLGGANLDNYFLNVFTYKKKSSGDQIRYSLVGYTDNKDRQNNDVKKSVDVDAARIQAQTTFVSGVTMQRGGFARFGGVAGNTAHIWNLTGDDAPKWQQKNKDFDYAFGSAARASGRRAYSLMTAGKASLSESEFASSLRTVAQYLSERGYPVY